MKHALSWFEIPVSDLSRAQKFYESILEIQMQELNLGNGLSMALFPQEAEGISGALCKHEQFYFPGKQGPILFLNANPDLAVPLSKVESSGGKILIAKRQISPDRGFMAVIEDTEGNRIALQSEK